MSTLKLVPEIGDPGLARAWFEEARRAGQTDAYAGKRQETRYAWESALEVHVSSPRGRGQTLHATAKNVSQRGIGFQCRQAISPFSQVTICLAGERVGVSAVVTHCTPTLTGHAIGARFNVVEQPVSADAHAVKVG